MNVIMLKLKQMIRNLFCFRRFNKEHILFQNGMTKVRKSLDLLEVVKKLRRLNVFSKIMLEDYQRAMLPLAANALL